MKMFFRIAFPKRHSARYYFGNFLRFSWTLLHLMKAQVRREKGIRCKKVSWI